MTKPNRFKQACKSSVKENLVSQSMINEIKINITIKILKRYSLIIVILLLQITDDIRIFLWNHKLSCIFLMQLYMLILVYLQGYSFQQH